MAFSVRIITDGGDKCAICRKFSSDAAPLIDMWLTGRSWSDRNYIAVHERCLLKEIAKAKEPIAALAAAQGQPEKESGR